MMKQHLTASRRACVRVCVSQSYIPSLVHCSEIFLYDGQLCLQKEVMLIRVTCVSDRSSVKHILHVVCCVVALLCVCVQ